MIAMVFLFGVVPILALAATLFVCAYAITKGVQLARR
jgi:hypothetical protein